jgi:predicted metal-binding membrane protein
MGIAGSDVSAIERLLKRDRQIVLVCVAAMVVLSGLYTMLGVGMEMSAIAMTGMPSTMLMDTAEWTPTYAVLVFLMWWIMMIAMMLPSAAPALLLYAAIRRRGRGPTDPVVMTAIFLLGYLSVWALFSLLATALQGALEYVGVVSGMLSVSNRALGGVVLLTAALYQFTPMKQACLTQCRNPVRFITGTHGAGRVGALRLGIRHGTYCVGCCGLLMLLLFFGGIMNLFWIAGIGIYVLLEKLLPRGRWLSHAAGIGMFAVGIWLVAPIAWTG